MCEISFDDEAGPQFCSDERPKARKPHKCDSCGRVIQVGEKYRRLTYGGGPDFSRVEREKCCTDCNTALFEFGDAHDAFPYPSTFAEVLEDCIADGDEESEKRWKPMLEALNLRRGAVAL